MHLPMVVSPYSSVVIAFLRKLQFIGRYGSSGPSNSTITSSEVLVCDSGCVKRAVWPGSRLRMREITECARFSNADNPEAAVVCFSNAAGSSGYMDDAPWASEESTSSDEKDERVDPCRDIFRNNVREYSP